MTNARPRRWPTRLAGYAWFFGWGLLLWGVHAPWEELGGLVGERMRWLERFVLPASWIVGATLGDLVRGSGRRSGRRGRLLIYPVGLASAAAMSLLALAGERDLNGVLFNGLTAYVSGALTTWLGASDWCRGAQEPDESSADGASHVA